MAKLVQLLKNPLFLLLLGLGVFIAFFAFVSTRPEDKTPSPGQDASLPKNIDLYIKKEPSTESLTQEEVKYAEATPQVFPSADPIRTGTLIVISDPPNVNVVLEQNSGEEISNYKLPYNITPFKAEGVPVGNYVITAAKQGYEYVGELFKVEENKITRVLIKLPLLRQ